MPVYVPVRAPSGLRLSRGDEFFSGQRAAGKDASATDQMPSISVVVVRNSSAVPTGSEQRMPAQTSACGPGLESAAAFAGWSGARPAVESTTATLRSR